MPVDSAAHPADPAGGSAIRPAGAVMDGALWLATRRLFDEVMALPAADRAGFLAAVTAPPAVTQEVRSLLAHAGSDTGDELFAAPLPRLTALQIGQRLGPWEVVSLLGQGGMGEVYQARRADGAYEGSAAVKVLKRGMDSAAVLARFASEQRALARLQHPNIAPLYDAGLTAGGVPYFVMAWVDGCPIDMAVQGLTVEQTLELFLQLADAVAHAHRQLLVHRDLKPGNVLVDQEGRVKLLDFGIAKALDPTEGAQVELTAVGLRPFTPSYASPEQVRGEPVGTATDIYSLGVLLYVMLTSQRPYGRAASNAAEAARAVLEDEPTRPSALPPVGHDTGAWQMARKRLQGDLDNILLKALAKLVALRYVSVEALAADVRAHLRGFPVSARPPSPSYLLSRFVRRNRAIAAGAALAMVALLGGAGLAIWQARLADAQRDVAQQRFKQVRQLANQLVFKYHDQIEHLPGATKAREALLVDAAAFLDSLDQAATDDPQLAYELASTYYRISRLQGVNQSINIGQHGQAEINLDKALALTSRYVNRPEMSAEVLGGAINMHIRRGELWQRRGHMAEADAALRRGLPLLERVLARDARDTWALTSAITLHGVRARILGSDLDYSSLGLWREACDSADRARAAADTTLAADPINIYLPDTLAFTLGEQAQCRLLAGRVDEAVRLFSQQVGLREQMAGKFPNDMDFRYQHAIARSHLARALSAQGQHVPARQALETALTLARQAAAIDPGNQAGQQRIDVMSLTSVQLRLAAGERALARAEADALLHRAPDAASTDLVQTRWRAEAMIWAARAWRPAQPRRALALAHGAAALLVAVRPDDDDVTRRWLLAQAQGEQAMAWAQTGNGAQATAAARIAWASWQASPPLEGPPPSLAPWIEPLRVLLSAELGGALLNR